MASKTVSESPVEWGVLMRQVCRAVADGVVPTPTDIRVMQMPAGTVAQLIVSTVEDVRGWAGWIGPEAEVRRGFPGGFAMATGRIGVSALIQVGTAPLSGVLS